MAAESYDIFDTPTVSTVDPQKLQYIKLVNLMPFFKKNVNCFEAYHACC